MNRRAVVLGAGGFVGSHLARHLLSEGWQVTGVVRDAGHPATQRRLGDIAGDVQMLEGDATDPELLRRAVAGAGAVFPFAGRSGAAASMSDPLADLGANAGGQLAVLEAVRAANPDARVVFPGSRLQYGRCLAVPVGEEHPQRPLCVYGAHKRLGEDYHRLFHDIYGIATTTLRISNPYGPHQDRPDGRFGIVGTFLSIASADGDIQLYGGGTQLRDYIYISDLTRLCELAVARPEAAGEVFNASGPSAVSLREMAEAVVEVVGRGRVVTAEWPPDEAAVETGDYAGDTSKAARLLGWAPEVGLREGLRATWEALSPVLAGTM